MIEESRMASIRAACAAVVDALGPQRFEAPALYVVATPIGNTADLTVRAIAVLHMADLIAAEDTRHARGLLDRLGVRAQLIACHEHNEREAAEIALEGLAQGARLAYVSDAGTPGISDPGARLVQAVRGAGFPVVPIPGPSAIATALSVGGLLDSAFHFAGFLPSKVEARTKAIAALAALNATLVFYEAPHRVRDTVIALADVLGPQRQCVIARELTKLHEQIGALPLGEAARWLDDDANRMRGEFVLLVEGASAIETDDTAAIDQVLVPLVRELPLKQAVALAVEIGGSARNTVYARALALKAIADQDGS